MVLRLVLVGAVAGLGLNLPSRRDLETWGHSAQRWVNARIAEWETRDASAESAFVFIAETTEQAPSSSAQNAVSDRGFSEVVEAMALSFSQEMAAAGTPESVDVSVDAVKAPGTDVPEALAIAPPAVAAPSEPELLVEHDQVFDNVLEEVVSSFVAELAAIPALDNTNRAFEAVVDGMVATFSADLVAMNREHQKTREKVVVVVPADENDDLFPGVAYALNRANDGLDHSAPKSNEAIVDGACKAPVEPVIRVDQLGNAVRLTREAVFAWASLLHGPAVVTLSR